jgi:uncharacterized protein (TIGR00369 family)
MSRPKLPDAVAPDLLERLRARFHPWPLITGWNLSIEAVAPGQAVMLLRPGDAVMNGPRGVVNGGVLATIADMVSALALSTAFDGLMPFATSDLHIRYLEPARGETRAEATVMRLSPRGGVTECRIHCGKTMVALCTANFAITPNLPG